MALVQFYRVYLIGKILFRGNKKQNSNLQTVFSRLIAGINKSNL
jgi:hypothetical protein